LWKHSGNRLNVIIQHYKFNTFIAMFLIISEIYLFLFRTHVKLRIEVTDTGCGIPPEEREEIFLCLSV
ncbi:hypothetical protein L4X47_16390, partial [Phocaeicola vulgatus]|nr:hypothetical protein [Phocaeicola vulgatus]